MIICSVSLHSEYQPIIFNSNVSQSNPTKLDIKQQQQHQQKNQQPIWTTTTTLYIKLICETESDLGNCDIRILIEKAADGKITKPLSNNNNNLLIMLLFNI